MEKQIKNQKIINTLLICILGLVLGTFSKYLDTQSNLPHILMVIDEIWDVHNYLGRFAFWVLMALCISLYSLKPLRASLNVFVFFISMLSSYYMYSYYVAGFFPRSYAMMWFLIALVSPILAYICWYGKKSLMIASILLAILFDMCFVYGRGYFNPVSILECVTYLIGVVVLKRKTNNETLKMVGLSLLFAFVLRFLLPFCLF